MQTILLVSEFMNIQRHIKWGKRLVIEITASKTHIVSTRNKSLIKNISTYLHMICFASLPFLEINWNTKNTFYSPLKINNSVTHKHKKNLLKAQNLIPFSFERCFGGWNFCFLFREQTNTHHETIRPGRECFIGFI